MSHTAVTVQVGECQDCGQRGAPGIGMWFPCRMDEMGRHHCVAVQEDATVALARLRDAQRDLFLRHDREIARTYIRQLQVLIAQ